MNSRKIFFRGLGCCWWDNLGKFLFRPRTVTYHGSSPVPAVSPSRHPPHIIVTHYSQLPASRTTYNQKMRNNLILLLLLVALVWAEQDFKIDEGTHFLKINE
jgi:hypothetical protein